MNMAQMALRWILMHPAVTCTIPGARHVAQVEENAAASDMAPLSAETMKAIQEIYSQRIRALVHHYW
jgi:aryl-alcohol dehydrogenase-like predicted oxidoreductase